MLPRIAIFAAVIVALAASGYAVAFDIPAAQLERLCGRGIRENRNRQRCRLPPELFEIRFRDLELDSEGAPLEESENLVLELRRRRYEAEVRGGCGGWTPMGRDKKERGSLSSRLVLRGH